MFSLLKKNKPTKINKLIGTFSMPNTHKFLKPTKKN